MKHDIAKLRALNVSTEYIPFTATQRLNLSDLPSDGHDPFPLVRRRNGTPVACQETRVMGITLPASSKNGSGW